MSNFLNKSNWKDIIKGYIYDAVIFYPSDTKRPLEFFIPDENNPRRGSLVSAIGDFSPKLIDGKYRAVEQMVVVKLKPRKVLVVSNNDINHNEYFEYIIVAPIMSISESDKKKNWYNKLKNDDHPLFVYLPEKITGKECYIDVSEITSIHKGMLLNKLVEIPYDILKKVEDTIVECLDLGVIEEEVDVVASNE